MSSAAPPRLMAMAAMGSAAVLQQQQQLNSSSRPYRSTSSSQQAFCSGKTIPSGRCILRSRIHSLSGRWVAKAGGEGGANGRQEVDNTNSSSTSVAASPGDPKLSGSTGGGGAKGFGAPSKAAVPEKKKPSKSASGSVRRATPSKPLIGVSPVDKQTQQVETAVVGSLVFLFAVILLEGLLLAGSGFLPEEWDQFTVNSVYPSFTPSVGVFLAIAASYGLWKSLGGGTGQSSR